MKRNSMKSAWRVWWRGLMMDESVEYFSGCAMAFMNVGTWFDGVAVVPWRQIPLDVRMWASNFCRLG